MAAPGESPEHVREALSLSFAGALLILRLPPGTLKSPSWATTGLGFKPRQPSSVGPALPASLSFSDRNQGVGASSPTHSVTRHSYGDQVQPSEWRTLEKPHTPPASGSCPSQEPGARRVWGPCTSLGLGRVGWALLAAHPVPLLLSFLPTEPRLCASQGATFLSLP